MPDQLQTVLWISAVGATILFCVFAAMIALLYLLTTPWLLRRTTPAAAEPVASAPPATGEDEEQERRRRAAALAVAVACAESTASFVVADAPVGWRLMHRTRRLGQTAPRRQVRS